MVTNMNTQTTELNRPRISTKQAKLVDMLSRKSGVTITKASEALGWQPHTTRAALTGLKKRGYNVERQGRDGKDSIYVIKAGETT